MKKLMTIALLFLTIGIFAQKLEKIFFDKEWKGVKSESNASFYRLYHVDGKGKPRGRINDYYITGERQGETDGAISIDKESDANSKFTGKSIGYFKSGKVNFETIYSNKSALISNKHYYENGNVEWETKYKGDSESSITYYENGNKYTETKFVKGIPEGTFLEYHQNGKIKYKSEYRAGVVVNGSFIECDEFSGCRQVFFEGFNTLASNGRWQVENTDEVRAQVIQEEGYLIENKTSNGVSFRTYNPTDISTEFTIESIITFKDGDKTSFHGLQFGFLDWDNYSYFYISATGEYRIGHIIDGLSYGGITSKSEYINPDKAQNIIKISMYNSQMQYAVNGQIIFSGPFVPFKGNNHGFTTGGKSEVLFKNLIVKQSIHKLHDINGAMSEWRGNGSGFFIDPTGIIATNYHVIDGAKQIEVTFVINGVKKSFNAKVISSDQKNDLSLIKIDDPKFKTLKKIPYSFKNNVSDVGSSVFAMGYPMALSLMGEEVKFTDGKISSKSGFKDDVKDYQISVPIQPGNSGGPLFDYEGNVVGIVTSKLTAAENVGYAIKSNYLNTLTKSLPSPINLPNEISIATKSLTDKIKVISDYVVLIKTK